MLNVITKTALLPSFVDGLLIVNVGTGSLSTIVLVPEAEVFNVLPEVTVPLNVKVSFNSSIESSMVGTLTVAVVCPAGIVTVTVDGFP